MSNLNKILLQILQLQTRTINTIKQTTIVKETNNNDYTAFEVFAHDYEIPVGDNEELGGYVNNVIPSSLNCKFVIRSTIDPIYQDTTIDWGDGSIEKISQCIFDNNNNSSEFITLLNHDYKKNGKYIIKIFGKDYFSFCSLGGYTAWRALYKSSIIISRVLERDLPIASHIKNLSSLAHSSLHILNINLGVQLNDIQLVYSFKNCTNLLQALNFEYVTRPISVYDTFNGCASLTYSSLRLPSVIMKNSILMVAGTYAFCAKLDMNIEDLLPENGFFGKTIDMTNTFVNCKKLTGTVSSNYLWNDKNINFINTTKTFRGCNSLKSQVPISWGGEASDEIIQMTDKEKIQILEERILALENMINSK